MNDCSPAPVAGKAAQHIEPQGLGDLTFGIAGPDQRHARVWVGCRFPNEYALANRIHHPRNVLLREDKVVPALDGWLAQAFAPHRLTDTLHALEAAHHGDTPHDEETEQARKIITDCDRKLVQHRAALEAGADPTLVTGWIRETQAQRAAAEARLGQPTQERARLSKDQIAGLVAAHGDILAVLDEADPADKAEIYRQLGLQLTYHPGSQTVIVESRPEGIMCVSACPRGDSTRTHMPVVLRETLSLIDTGKR